MAVCRAFAKYINQSIASIYKKTQEWNIHHAYSKSFHQIMTVVSGGLTRILYSVQEQSLA
jgi:hypothetical protein